MGLADIEKHLLDQLDQVNVGIKKSWPKVTEYVLAVQAQGYLINQLVTLAKLQHEISVGKTTLNSESEGT